MTACSDIVGPMRLQAQINQAGHQAASKVHQAQEDTFRCSMRVEGLEGSGCGSAAGTIPFGNLKQARCPISPNLILLDDDSHLFKHCLGHVH